jgi:hypothetical protein
MTQFCRSVQERISASLSRRLDEIDRACKMDWTADDLRDYTWRSPNCFHVGKQLAVKDLGALYFCLELDRAKGSVAYGALVYLYRQRSSLAVDLWARLERATSDTAYCEGNSLIFERGLSEEEIPDFSEHLNRALDDCLGFIEGCAGLKKYVPQKS